MKLATNGDFTEWELTAADIEKALQLSPETKAYIQNLKVQAAADLLNNLINPATGTAYDELRRARTVGQIEAYSMLLAGDIPANPSPENQA